MNRGYSRMFIPAGAVVPREAIILDSMYFLRVESLEFFQMEQILRCDRLWLGLLKWLATGKLYDSLMDLWCSRNRSCSVL